MRESIGTISLLNFVIFFILLVFAFLMGTFSYYKAFRVNNEMVKAIEKYEGYNELSKNAIYEQLGSLNYEAVKFVCPDIDGANIIAGNGNGLAGTPIDWYCVYERNDTYEKTASGGLAKTDPYHSYDVVTLVTFKFPMVDGLLKMRVSARTRRIYDFEGSLLAH